MLSVIVPVYNVEKYLRQCLDSIVNQIYKDLEIVIVNDGSNDGSLSIIKEYAALDNRIKVIDKENGGLVSAYTTGYEYATGEYITFVDSDDWCELNMFTDLMDKFNKYDIDLVISTYKRGYDENTLEKSNCDFGLKEGIHDNKDNFYYKVNQHAISAARWGKIYKKTKLDSVISNIDISVNFAEDIMVALPYAMAIKNYYYIDKAYYYYRIVDGSISKRFNEKAIFDVTKIYNTLMKFDYKYNDKLLDGFMLEIYLRLIYNIMQLCDFKDREKYFKLLISEPLFKKVKKCKGWHCNSNRQRMQKFFYKYMPMVYLKLSTLKRKLKG